MLPGIWRESEAIFRKKEERGCCDMHTYFCDLRRRNAAEYCNDGRIKLLSILFRSLFNENKKIAQGHYGKENNNAWTPQRNHYEISFSCSAHRSLMNDSPLENKCAVHSTSQKSLSSTTMQSECNRGSATIETVCVLPVLFFCFLAFYLFGQIYIMEDQIYQAARNTADYLAESAYITELYDSEGMAGTATEVVGIGLANARLQKELKDNSRVEHYVRGGRQGIVALSTDLLDEEGYICFVLHYQLQIRLPFLKTMSAHMRIPITQKAYTGYTPENGTYDTDEIYVYVTEQGSVYHRTRSCTHLKVTIHAVSKDSLEGEYKKLPPCEYCGRRETDTYYISEYGECYHSANTCSRLKRSISRVRLKDVQGMPACSACGGS